MNGLILRWVGDAFRLYPGRVSLLLVFSVLKSFIDALSISMLIPLLSILFEGTAIGDAGQGVVPAALGRLAAIAPPQHRLAFLAAIIVGLVGVRVLLAHLNNLNVARLSTQLGFDMCSRIHANLLGVDYQFICVTDNGKLINTLDNETWSVTEAIFTVFDLFSSICMVAALGTFLLLISWPLTLLVIALVGLVSLLRRLADRRVRELGRQKLAASEALSIRAYELLDSMRMTRAFGREAVMQREFDRLARRLLDIDVAAVRLNSAVSSLQELLYAGIVAILLLAAVAIGLGEASLIAFLALLHRVQPSLLAIDQTRTALIQSSSSIKAVSDLLALPPWSRRTLGTRRLDRLEHAIAFEDVTFSYAGRGNERRPALEAVSFTIPIGRTTALVGASGAGKSTITNLLYRFHDPETGRITVDGVPLDQLDLGWWRGRLAISGQDTGLISGSVRENIALSRPEATPAEIEAAARAAGIDGFIRDLPLGYETQIGEHGVLLSGGQRQRIELARALLRPDAILILDEATNALDSMTEHEVLQTLKAMAGQRTILIIAHRLSTTRHADHVIVLSRGRVAEEGEPGALYKAGGLFARMVELQELGHLVSDPDFVREETGAPLSAGVGQT